MLINGEKKDFLQLGSVAKRKVTFQELAPYLSFSGVDVIFFGFNPDWLGLDYNMQEFEVDDSNPFIKGDFGVEKDYMIPSMIIT